MNKVFKIISSFLVIAMALSISTIATFAASEKRVDISDSNGCYITISNFVSEKTAGYYPLYVANAPVTVKYNGDGLSRELIIYNPEAKFQNGEFDYGNNAQEVLFDVKKCYYIDKTKVVDENPECGDMPTYVTGNYVTLSKPGYYIVEGSTEAAAGSTFILQVTDGNTTVSIPENVSATPTASKVLVNGKEVSFEAYNIKGSNYFKLRDVAMAVNGTAKNFEVGWDSTNKAIGLTSGKAYTAAGGELAVSAKPAAKEAKLSTSEIYLDGVKVQLTAYNIGGNNYFKLRDLAKALNIGVTWDNKTSTIGIDTSIAYTE